MPIDNPKLFSTRGFEKKYGRNWQAKEKALYELARTGLIPNVVALKWRNVKLLILPLINSFLPSVLARPTLTLDQLKNYAPKDVLSESIWDTGEMIANAAILAVGRDGAIWSDKVVHDVRNRNLSGLASRGGGHFVASGSALGDRGWLIGFGIN